MFKEKGNIHFQVKLEFKDMQEAVKVADVLKKYKFEVSAIIERKLTYTHRERRLNSILNILSQKPEPISIGKLYRFYMLSFNCSYKTFQRDIAILLLQNKISAEKSFKKGQTTLIKRLK